MSFPGEDSVDFSEISKKVSKMPQQDSRKKLSAAAYLLDCLEKYHELEGYKRV